MRSVVIRRGAALLALVILLTVAPVAVADDPPNPFEPPEARLQPPIGIAMRIEAPALFDVILIMLQAGAFVPV